MSAPVGVTSSFCTVAAVDRRVAEQAERRRRRYRDEPVRRLHHSASHIERRADDAIGVQPLEREHRPDDIDDRVERPDFVEVHLLDRHLMNGRLGHRQPVEQRLGAIAAGRRQRASIDQGEDFRQTSVRVGMGAVVPFERWFGGSC